MPFIGLSATPLRADLGLHFESVVRGPSTADLTEQGYLVPAKAYYPGAATMEALLADVKRSSTPQGMDYDTREISRVMRDAKVVGGIVAKWKELASGRPTIAFAVDKAHSRDIVHEFESHGIPSAHIEDKTPDEERRRIFAAFNAGRVTVLSSVGVLSVGFDSPLASCGVLARPTLSLALHIQQTGRVLRPHEGKTDCLLLDHVGNVYRHGLPAEFEIPDTLATGRHKTGISRQRKPKKHVCEGCGYQMAEDCYVCPECGLERPKKTPRVEYVDGEMVEYGTEGSGRCGAKRAAKTDPMDEYRQLKWYAREYGYKDGWVFFKWMERHPTAGKPPYHWRNIEPAPISQSLARWVRSRNIAFAKAREKR